MQKLVKVLIICLKLNENTNMLYFWDRSLKKKFIASSWKCNDRPYALLADISVHFDVIIVISERLFKAFDIVNLEDAIKKAVAEFQIYIYLSTWEQKVR